MQMKQVVKPEYYYANETSSEARILIAKQTVLNVYSVSYCQSRFSPVTSLLSLKHFLSLFEAFI